MKSNPFQRLTWLMALSVVCFGMTQFAHAYVEVPYSLGRLVQESTHVMTLQVEKVDKVKNLIIFRKVKDIKGTHAGDVVKHNIGKAGFHPRESETIMKWAEPGKIAVFMHNGGASETCIGGYWYQAYPQGEWWGMSHGEPFLNRSFAGKTEKLATSVASMLTGQEVVVPCMMDGDKNALQLGTAKIHRLKASLKIQDYNPQRDFQGVGGNEDFRALLGMPGFSQLCELPRVDPGASGIVPFDFDGDKKVDLCLYGEARVCLLRNEGKSLSELSLPYTGGARSADWGDFNQDGKPDLLLATAAGPKLLTNLGETFRDDTGGLPLESYYNLSGAMFADVDGDRLLDVVLANGFLGWSVYRNLGPEAAKVSAESAVGKWFYCGPFDNTNRIGFNTPYPPEANVDLKAVYAGKGGAKVAWKEGKFTDGQVNSLTILPDNNNVTCYLYREFYSGGTTDLPASFGSDDSLVVFLNGQKILAEDVDRGAVPDQSKAVLKLKPGKNQLLLKIGQGTGDFAFYFRADAPLQSVPPLFENVTAKFAPLTAAAGHLVKADFNADGRPDLLLCGAQPCLLLGDAKGFVEQPKHGLRFDGLTAMPAVGDFDGDKLPDLLMPHAQGVRLYRNFGQGTFSDVTAQVGDLAKLNRPTAAVAFGNLDVSGRPGILVGCLKEPNRYFQNSGAGKFIEMTDALGLQQKVFNTRGICAVDFNHDGTCDVLFNNEGQASVALLGSADGLASLAGKKGP